MTDDETESIAVELRSTVRSFLERRVTLAAVADAADDEQQSPDLALWSELAALGWTGLALPELAGGFAAGPRITSVLFEESGRVLLPAPLFSVTALAGPICADDQELARGIVDGSVRPTLAWRDANAGMTELSAAGSTTCRAVQDVDRILLTGRKTRVLDVASATHLIVVAQEESGVGIYVTAVDSPGVSITPSSSIDGTRREYVVSFDGAPARVVALVGDAEAVLTNVRDQALFALANECVGVGDRILADIVEHARVRQQFGKAIGSFQAVSIPLVECFIDLETARALTSWAALALEQQAAESAVAVAAAASSAADAALRTCERAIQVAGAIGFTWEYHIHRFLRRALFARTFDGDPSTHQAEIAAAILDPERVLRTVEFMDTSSTTQIRQQTRQWVEENFPTREVGLDLIRSKASYDERRELWRRAMCSSGRLVAHWPVDSGGLGAPDAVTAIFREEAIKAHPRVSDGDCGYDLVAPLLMNYGTSAQQLRFLDGIRTENVTWTQGFSEPDAGSDLASLRTRATRDGADWIMNGSKIWATYGPVADWIFVLARTDPEATRHRGISCFLVDARTPGVRVRPIRDITGSEEFAEVFFTDARVPGDCLLGEENQGWNVAIMTLAHERVIESYEDIGELGFVIDRVIEALRAHRAAGTSMSDVDRWAGRLAELWSRYQAVRIVQYRAVLALDSGGTPPPESEIVKLVWSSVAQDVARLALDMSSAAHGSPPERVGTQEFWQWNYLNARSLTIYAGTTEIISSVIAERVLGLPRSR